MWYESQLFGIVVGAVLGFFLSYVPAVIERHRHNRALHGALLVEVERIVAYLIDRRNTYERYRSMLNVGGLLGLYTTDRQLDVVYQANVGNITALNPNTVAKLVEFYEGVSEFKGRIRALSASLKSFHDGSDKLLDQDFFVRALDQILKVIDQAIECGKELLGSRDSDRQKREKPPGTTPLIR